MAPATPPPSPSETRDDRFPPGIPCIVGNEAAERFSFYGMRQILFIYLTSLFIGFAAENTVPAGQLADAEVRATQLTHLFNAGVYLFPLVGAILADRLLGKYRVIFYVSLVYCAGSAGMAVAGQLGILGHLRGAELAAYAGLLLIALGSGGIKPCVSANVGDQFTAKNAHLVTRIFQIFYFVINFGSFFASVLTPWLYKDFGAAVAFGVPGVLMALATLVFWAGRHRFVRVPPKPGGAIGALDFTASTLMLLPLLFGIFIALEESKPVVNAVMAQGTAALPAALGAVAAQYWWLAVAGFAALFAGLALAHARQRRQEDSGFLAVLLYCFRQRHTRRPGESFWEPARRHFGEEAAEGPPAVLRIMLVFSMVSVFWALFDQHSSTWVKQAKSMDLNLVVPSIVWSYWLVPAAIAGALFGAAWLFLWVSNRPVPRKAALAALALAGAWLAAALGCQAAFGEKATITLLPAQIAALNPLLVMIIIPLLNAAVYHPLERRGRPLAPLHRMTIGMFLAAVSFAAVALIQARIEAAGAGQVHVLWQLVPYLLITTGEVLVSVTGLEFAYTQAPRAMKSTIMGFWLLCVTFGNILVTFLAPLQTLSLATFFWTFAGLMAAAALLFVFLAATYKGKSYMQA
jgi:POT family proton-dependent oligopeptide transporter